MINSKVIYQELIQTITPEKILQQEPMNKHTSFKIGGSAEFYVKATSIEEIKRILNIVKKYEIPYFILGNGTNILVKDEGINGIVIKIEIDEIQIQKQEQQAIITVGAGVKLCALAQKLLQQEISGFEFASGIPGTIGGAIRMNAGAHGKEMKEIIVETTCMDECGNIHILNNEEQKFEYRNSIFSKLNYIIIGTKLKLEYGEKENIRNQMQEYAIYRKEKQPIEQPSAGSTFKRGNGFITAQLIDEAGLKGYKIGDAQVSTKHAGFIVNVGNATAKDVLTLVEEVKNEIKQKFNKDIELEIQVIG